MSRVWGRIELSETPTPPPSSLFTVPQTRRGKTPTEYCGLNSGNIFRSFGDQAGSRNNFQSEVLSDLTERRPLIKRTPKMAVSVFKPKLTRRGGLRTSGVLRRTSMGPSILQYFGIFHGSFFALDQETQ